LLAPLTLACVGGCFFLNRKFNDVRFAKKEPVAKNPFPPHRSWAWEEQEIMKTKHDVKQLACKRVFALGNADLAAEKEGVTLLALPDLTGIRHISNYEKRDSVQALENVRAADLPLAVEDVTDAPEALMDDAIVAPWKIQVAPADQGLAPILETPTQLPEESGERVAQAEAPNARNAVSSVLGRIRSGLASLWSQAPAPLDLEVREIRQTHAEQTVIRARTMRAQAEEEADRDPRFVSAPALATGLRSSANPGDAPMPPDLSFNFVQDPDREELMLRILDL
jgi:hypothetical protein